MLNMLFGPSEIVQRAREKVDDSFYASLNGPPQAPRAPHGTLIGGLNTGLPVSFNGSGVLMPFNVRKEPSVFWRKIDQFQHIQDRVSGRRPFNLLEPFFIAGT